MLLVTTTPVDPIVVLTQGGYYAVISGIDPSSEDCLEGYLLIPGEEPKVFEAAWNRSGTCRDRSESANVNPSRSEDLAKYLEVINKYNAS
jgi:hypothetical protein